MSNQRDMTGLRRVSVGLAVLAVSALCATAQAEEVRPAVAWEQLGERLKIQFKGPSEGMWAWIEKQRKLDYESPNFEDQELKFVDQALEKCVRAQLGQEAGPLTRASVWRLLDISCEGLPSLEDAHLFGAFTIIRLFDGDSYMEGMVIAGHFRPGILEGDSFYPGILAKDRFINGWTDSSSSAFVPGRFSNRVLDDTHLSVHFMPGLDIGDRFVPGIIYGERFVPGVAIGGGFAPGVYDKKDFVPGVVTADGFKHLPDSNELADLIRFGNPYGWDLEDSYTPTDEPPDFMAGEEDSNPFQLPGGAESKINGFRFPVGYGSGSKPTSSWEFTLPGHDAPLSVEIANEIHDLVDLDGDGRSDIGGFRVSTPLAQPAVGEEGTFPIGNVIGVDIANMSSAVGIGNSSSGGGVPNITGDPTEDLANILGGINPNRRSRIPLGDPGPEGGDGLDDLLGPEESDEEFERLLNELVKPPVPPKPKPPENFPDF